MDAAEAQDAQRGKRRCVGPVHPDFHYGDAGWLTKKQEELENDGSGGNAKTKKWRRRRTKQRGKSMPLSLKEDEEEEAIRDSKGKEEGQTAAAQPYQEQIRIKINKKSGTNETNNFSRQVK